MTMGHKRLMMMMVIMMMMMVVVMMMMVMIMMEMMVMMMMTMIIMIVIPVDWDTDNFLNKFSIYSPFISLLEPPGFGQF